MADSFSSYRIIKDFTSAGAGTSTWCIAEKGGAQYFIKQFLSPVLVAEESRDKLPAAMVDSMQKACVRFVAQKRNLYSVLNAIQNGALAAPQDLMVYNGHYLSVSEYVKQSVPSSEIHTLEPWQRLMLMRTMVLCLKALSEKHIVHSDIKLDNLLVAENEEGGCWLKLIDFDSAFFENDPPREPNDFHGDVVYFAPEAMVFQSSEGETDIRLDCKMDAFALGLVLHQMWCGALPGFDAKEFTNAAEALLCGSELTLSQALPPEVRQVCEGLLRLDPEQRLDYDKTYALLGRAMNQYPAPPTPEKQPIIQKERKLVPVENPSMRPLKRFAAVLLALVMLASLVPLLGIGLPPGSPDTTGKAICGILLGAGLVGELGLWFR